MVQPIRSTNFLENTPGPYYKVVQITSLSPTMSAFWFLCCPLEQIWSYVFASNVNHCRNLSPRRKSQFSYFALILKTSIVIHRQRSLRAYLYHLIYSVVQKKPHNDKL